MLLSHHRLPADVEIPGGVVEIEMFAPPPLILPKSTMMVLPYPVTLNPVPTKLISVNPTPILASGVMRPD